MEMFIVGHRCLGRYFKALHETVHAQMGRQNYYWSSSFMAHGIWGR